MNKREKIAKLAARRTALLDELWDVDAELRKLETPEPRIRSRRGWRYNATHQEMSEAARER